MTKLFCPICRTSDGGCDCMIFLEDAYTLESLPFEDDYFGEEN